MSPKQSHLMHSSSLLVIALVAGCGDDETTTSTPDTIIEEPEAGVCRGVPLPTDQHYVAPGLCASAVALDQGRLRQISFTSDGDLLGVRTNGEILRYRDLNDDGMFEGSAEVSVIATTGGNGNNAHLDEAGGYLYAGSPDGVVRFPYSTELEDLGDPEPVIVNQPSSGTHSYHTVHVYDGWLYVHSGSENNFVAPAMPEFDTNRSVLKRFELAGFDAAAPWDWTTAGEVFVRGVRNMVGFTRAPDGRLFGVVNGIDNLAYQGQDIHLDNPGEDLLLLEEGNAYGYPYCFTAAHVEVASDMVPPGTQLASGVMDETDIVNPHDDAWCAANSAGPVTFLPAHSAPLDIVFHAPDTGSALPSDWVGGAFVTQHGSWNDSPSVGHRVVMVPFDDGGGPEMPRTDVDPDEFPFPVVFSGGSAAQPVDGTWSWSNGDAGEDPVRPVGVAISPVDGALYISSDNAGGDTSGALYRIGTIPE